jgi:hypothetical protein
MCRNQSCHKVATKNTKTATESKGDSLTGNGSSLGGTSTVISKGEIYGDKCFYHHHV